MAKKAKMTAAETIEAVRLAKMMLRDEIKRQGMKVSLFSPDEVRKAAFELIDRTPSLVKQAKRNCKRSGHTK